MTVLEHFDKTVEDYSTIIEKVIIDFPTMMTALTANLPEHKSPRILDLGCGTGRSIKEILKAIPKAHVMGVDFAQKMVAQAEIELKEYKDQVIIKKEDITKGLSGTYDMVVASFTIHNLTHKQQKELFKEIGKVLVPGGLFISADFSLGETKQEQEEWKEQYLAYLKEGLVGEELQAWIYHATQEDSPMKLSEQKKLLYASGLEGFTTHCKIGAQVVYSAKKLGLDEDLQAATSLFEKGKKHVSFFGGHTTSEVDTEYEKAQELAKKYAKKGFKVVTGGGSGIMEAALKGAIDTSATIGIAARQFVHEHTDENLMSARHETISLEVRKRVMIREADELIFFPGGYGTLDEFFEAIMLIQNEEMEEKPIICVGKDYWGGLFAWLKSTGKLTDEHVNIATIIW